MLWLTGVLIAGGYVLMALTRSGWAIACYPVGNFVTTFGVVVANILQISFQQAVTPERLGSSPLRRMRALPLH
ncbi:hypothetical protein [Amycolatopsis sp. GM8]|uniref:hypothetical protein n=1 Tax=Amycolatopsis sp. GM8 TaxID=2896530 RepID=UPI001F3ECE36|nr:hypothetical protein [Amycolatopsis sp. GM8]